MRRTPGSSAMYVTQISSAAAAADRDAVMRGDDHGEKDRSAEVERDPHRPAAIHASAAQASPRHDHRHDRRDEDDRELHRVHHAGRLDARRRERFNAPGSGDAEPNRRATQRRRLDRDLFGTSRVPAAPRHTCVARDRRRGTRRDAPERRAVESRGIEQRLPVGRPGSRGGIGAVFDERTMLIQDHDRAAGRVERRIGQRHASRHEDVHVVRGLHHPTGCHAYGRTAVHEAHHAGPDRIELRAFHAAAQRGVVRVKVRVIARGAALAR